MSNARAIDDVVFGPMLSEQPSIWTGRAVISPFGEVGVRVEREDEESPPDERQRAVFELYLAQWDRLLPQAMDRIALYLLTELRPIYADIFEPQELEEVLPAKLNRSWVAKNISHAEVVVPCKPHDLLGNPLDISLNWECTWDPEHGVGVTIAGGIIADAGQPCGLG